MIIRTLPTRFLARATEIARHRTTSTYVVSYPKTGNTWLRFMLGLYAQMLSTLPEPPLFDDSNRIGIQRGIPHFPPLRFTHRPLTWERQRADDLSYSNVIEPFRRKRVVLLVRHPLDVLVSNFHQQANRTARGTRGGLEAFAEDPVFGIDKLLRFYGLWREYRGSSADTHLVRYEDLHANADATLRAVLAFLGVPCREEPLLAAIQGSEFTQMQAVEMSEEPPMYRSSGRPIFASGDLADPNARHVRRGIVGGYRDELPSAAIARLECRVIAEMGDWYRYDGPDL